MSEITLDSLRLSKALTWRLRAGGVQTCADVQRLGAEGLLTVPGIGFARRKHVVAGMARLGLPLTDEPLEDL